MYPFPQVSDLHFLIDLELEQISLGRWQIQFNFDKARIHVEFDLEHIDKSGTRRRHNTDEDRFSPILLHHLLGQKVKLIEVEPLSLNLTFDSGDIIRILTEVSAYECGQIYDNEGRLFVLMSTLPS